jgi:hypothetical protein
MRTVTHRAARFEPGGAVATATPTTQPVRTAAVWKVKVRERGEKDYHGIDGTERLLQRGDVVGFRKGDDGVIYAVVNKEEIPLALTSDHRRVVWQAKTEKPTDFGRGMAEVIVLTTDAVMVVGVAVGLGAMWLISQDAENDQRERDQKRYVPRN